tara:strand:- start:1951 stop:3174 length:1224 start_codon:yes stop_codon:yes gene_type:complete
MLPRKNYLLISQFLFIIFHSFIFSQNEIHISTNSSMNKSYWWAQNGVKGIDHSKKNIYGSLSIKKDKIHFKLSSHIFDDNINVHETFLKYKINNTSFIRIGKYYRDYSSYLNNDLSSGHLLVSHNALPMSKIGFVKSKNFKKVSFEGGISHGYLDKNSDYTKRPFLHEKFIYLHYDNQSYKYSFGFLHEAIWGGSTLQKGVQPNDLSDFWRVFISADRKIEDYDIVPDTHLNALGNHLGVWEFVVQKIDNNKIIKLYYQHFFEDTSGLRFNNGLDGLWGFEFNNKNKKINLLLEYLRTVKSTMDSYYNHGTYVRGWSYKDQAIGSPFIEFRNLNPGELLHFASKINLKENVVFNLKISKHINRKDDLKYKLLITRETKNQIPNISVIAYGNKFEKSPDYALRLSWNL